MSTNRKVNLFLVGAAKSGTTSLAELLKKHEEICVPHYKEPFYFIEGNGLDTYEEYIDLYKLEEDKKYWVDASTGYLFEHNIAERIYNYNPDARILIVLRNPIDFCISYWRYMRVNGSENLDFNKAISDGVQDYRNTKEFANSIDDWPQSYQYIKRAKYYRQVKSYIDIFGADKVKVCIFEDLIKDENVLKSIFDFIELPDKGLLSLPKENSSGDVNKVFHFLRFSNKLKGVKRIFKKLIKNENRMKIRKKMISLSTSKSKKVDFKVNRKEMCKKFDNDVQLLKEILPNVNFDSWHDFK